ncbi:hypothetical protein [Methanobrevibacter sp. DSM 116169]|uniref:hypothetical protein n=1 Tax=Methanobrevibacter sp. DSM 116169 TaxID=3242727 RepID=UPI0038FD3DAB
MEKYKQIIAGILIIAAIISIGAYGYGFLNSDLTQSTNENVNTSQDIKNTTNNSTKNTTDENEDYKIVIDYDGPFTAGYGSANAHDDVTSSGHREYDLGKTTYVDVGVKKSDSSNNELKVTIYKGNTIVKEDSTSEPNGEIVLHYEE